MQECADPGIDPLLLLIANYARFAKAINFYGHQTADAASLIGKIASTSRGRCMPE
jgi:hypothetical protein